MKKIKIGSVVSIEYGGAVHYGVVSNIDVVPGWSGHKGSETKKEVSKLDIVWACAPRNPNLRRPRAWWFEMPHKNRRFEVVRW